MRLFRLGAMAFAPPSRWQSDEVGTIWSQQLPQPRANGLGGTGSSIVPQAGEVDTLNNAWKHVKGVVVNDGKAADLYDLLLQTGKETIEPMPAGVRLISALEGGTTLQTAAKRV